MAPLGGCDRGLGCAVIVRCQTDPLGASKLAPSVMRGQTASTPSRNPLSQKLRAVWTTAGAGETVIEGIKVLLKRLKAKMMGRGVFWG
jgi:hypothetical protein